MPQTMEAKVQWLMDHTAINDVLLSLARALDLKDYQAYANNYVEGGCIELPTSLSSAGVFEMPKEKMPELIPKTFEQYSGTQHLVANHQINIDGDTARSTAYLQAVHVRGSLATHWTGGGLYNCEFLRTAEGWKFQRVRLTRVWLDGQLPESATK